MNRKLYQSKPFETEEINVVDTAERLARVNASDCRRATGPVSVVIQENTEDSLHLVLVRWYPEPLSQSADSGNPKPSAYSAQA